MNVDNLTRENVASHLQVRKVGNLLRGLSDGSMTMGLACYEQVWCTKKGWLKAWTSKVGGMTMRPEEDLCWAISDCGLWWDNAFQIWPG